MAGLGENCLTAAPECQTHRLSGGSHAVRVTFGRADGVGNLHWVSVFVRSSFWDAHYVSSA